LLLKSVESTMDDCHIDIEMNNPDHQSSFLKSNTY